jgi:hypothetical protein
LKRTTIRIPLVAIVVKQEGLGGRKNTRPSTPRPIAGSTPPRKEKAPAIVGAQSTLQNTRNSMAEARVEHIAKTSGNIEGAAERAAFLRAFPDGIDPVLAEIVAAWPNLPEAVRAEIVGKVRLAANGIL